MACAQTLFQRYFCRKSLVTGRVEVRPLLFPCRTRAAFIVASPAGRRHGSTRIPYHPPRPSLGQYVAMACLFLAAKVEESQRRIRHVMIVGRHVMHTMSR